MLKIVTDQLNPNPNANWQTEKTEKWLMPIGLNYQGHGISEKDVWMINSYYRISDGERGDRKWRTVKLYTFFVFVQSTYIGVNLNSKRFGNYCDPNEKDENNFWKNRRRKNCYRLAKPEFQCWLIFRNGKWCMHIGLNIKAWSQG